MTKIHIDVANNNLYKILLLIPATF